MANVTPIGVVAVVRNLSGFNAGMQTMRRQMGITGSNARTLGNSFQGVGQHLRLLGNQILILGFQLTFLAAGGMAAVIRSATDFESSMVKIITLVGVAEGRVQEWSDQLLEIAPALGRAPTELAEALFVITSAGIRDSAEAMDVLTSSSKAASIGLGEVDTVARAVTAAVQAYSQEGLTAAQATDILTATVREGNLEADTLAPTLGRVIPIAQQMGVTFDEVGAFLATFTRLGVPAQVAVTSLRAALTAILKPTQKAKDQLDAYGISIQDVRGAIREDGLAKTLLGLTAIFGDNDEAMSNLIGSARGLSGVLGVTGGLAESYIDILDSIQNATGITEEGFERFGETTQFQIDRAKASFEVLAITIGDILLPGINALLDKITEITLGIKAFADTHKDIVQVLGAILGFVTVMGPVLILTGILINAIGTVISIFGLLGAAMSFLVTPIGLLIAALSLLAAAFVFVLGASLQKTQEKLNAQGQSLSTSAFGWGRNIIIQFSNGMASAVRAVLTVLISIGIAIRKLLGPGSPPALLPDLPEWGKSAMEEFLKGWLLADFSIFNRVAGTLESFIRSLDIGETRVVPTILKVRDAIAKMIDTIRSGSTDIRGSVDKIAKSIGASAKLVRAYVVSMAELQIATDAVNEAQKRFDETTRKFNEQLKPLTDELKEIEKERDKFSRNLRREELEFIIADPRAGEDVRRLAELELRELDLKDQIAGIEDQRDAELSLIELELEAAKERQRIAQEQVDIIEAQLKLTTEQNNLLKEQAELLERLAKEKEKAAKEGTDITGGGGVPCTLEEIMNGDCEEFSFDNAGDFGAAAAAARMAEGITNPFTGPGGLLDTFDDILEEIEGQWADIPGLFDEMTDIWSDIFAELIGTTIPDLITTIDNLIIEIKRINDEELTFPNMIEGLTSLFNNIESLEDLVGRVATVAIPAITVAFGGAGSALATWAGAVIGSLGPVSNLDLSIGVLKDSLILMALNGLGFVSGILSSIFGPAFVTVYNFIKNNFQPKFEELRDFLANPFQNALSLLSIFLTTNLSTAFVIVEGFANLFGIKLGEIWDTIKNKLLGTLTELMNLVSGALSVALGVFRIFILEPLLRVFGSIEGAIQRVIDKVDALKETLSTLVIPSILRQSSPSPFEKTLHSTSAAMQELAGTSIPNLVGSMGNIDSGSIKRTMAAMPNIPAGNTRVNVATVNMGGQTINSDMDAAQFRAMVEAVVADMI